MKILKELYAIRSQSGNEKNLSRYIQKHLDALKIDYEVDKFHQVFCLHNRNKPLIAAHQDQVLSVEPCKSIAENSEYIIGVGGNLGADDKNGVRLMLALLKKQPNLNFIFSTQEETGSGKIENILIKYANELRKIPYGLVLDRRGNSDIIGVDNDYCTLLFQNDIAKIGKRFSYLPNIGSFSDGDALSEYISCVNLSVGYFDAHKKSEYTCKKSFMKALSFTASIVENLTRHYRKPTKFSYIMPRKRERINYSQYPDWAIL